MNMPEKARPAMKKLFWGVCVLGPLVGAFLLGAWYHDRKPLDANASGGGSVSVRDAKGDGEETSNNERVSVTPGIVNITPQKQQLMGVRIDVVERAPQSHVLRTFGRVAADENLTYRVVSSTEGWVSDIRESTTGSLVKKDQLMATVYNYQFLTREQQYLYALDFEDRRVRARMQAANPQSSSAPSQAGQQSKEQQTGTAQQNMPSGTFDMVSGTPGGEMNMSGRAVYSIRDQVEVAKLELYSLGVGDYQINEIARTRRLYSDIEIRSPVSGIVLNRNVSPQQRFERGIELFRIADLSRVWVIADVYGAEEKYIRPGMTAKVTLPGHENVFVARVTDVPPPFDTTTRSLKVRLEMENSGTILRPDMFVDVEFLINLPAALTVPADAVLDSGVKKVVFVDLGKGLFEPREVETGWRFGSRVEIRNGLTPGERIAMSGTFLIDSESRLELAAAGMTGTLSKDPVAGLNVSISKAEKTGRKSIYRGKTYYFASDESKIRFDKKPDQYAGNL